MEKLFNLLFINMNTAAQCMQGRGHKTITLCEERFKHSLILNFSLHFILIQELKRLRLIIHI